MTLELLEEASMELTLDALELELTELVEEALLFDDREELINWMRRLNLMICFWNWPCVRDSSLRIFVWKIRVRRHAALAVPTLSLQAAMRSFAFRFWRRSFNFAFARSRKHSTRSIPFLSMQGFVNVLLLEETEEVEDTEDVEELTEEEDSLDVDEELCAKAMLADARSESPMTTEADF